MGMGGGTDGVHGVATGSHCFRCESDSALRSYEALESESFEHTAITMMGKGDGERANRSDHLLHHQHLPDVDDVGARSDARPRIAEGELAAV